MSFFNGNITGAAGGLVTKFVKSIAIGSKETAEIQISLKDYISNYADITNEQIIVDIANVGASEAGTATLTQSYDAEQGVLTITSDSSKIPFVVDSTVEVDVYVAGIVQIPPVRQKALSVASYGNTESGQADSGSGSTQRFNFVVNVGQMAALSVGSGDTTGAIGFSSGASANSQGWSISDTRAILGSNRGGANTTSSNDNVALGCLLIMPTEETGPVSVSRAGGATSWTGISYIVLDINEA